MKDAAGRVVIPAGSKVTLQVTAIKESENKSDTHRHADAQADVDRDERSDRSRSPPRSRACRPHCEGRKTDGGDIAKVGAGTAAGAIVGRVIGGSSKGAIIGGVIGGAVGTQRAVETKDRDVVLPAGTQVTLTLDQKCWPAAAGDDQRAKARRTGASGRSS